MVLTYDAPPECPSANRVVEQTGELVRHPPSTPVRAKVTITRLAAGYALEIRVGDGKQNIVAESCDSLVQTLTVILALAIDPHAQDSAAVQDQTQDVATDEQLGGSPSNVELTPKSPPVAPPAAPSKPPPRGAVSTANGSVIARRLASVRRLPSATAPNTERRAEVEPPASTSSGRHTHTGVGLHPAALLLSELGMLPHFANGPSLGLWFDQNDWSVATTAEWLLPAWVAMPDTNPLRGGHISFLGGQLEICRALHQSRLAHACAGVEAGDLMGKGSGVLSTQIGHGFWLAGTLQLGARPRIWPFMNADLRLGIAIPVRRPAFGFDGYSWRFEPRAWSVRLSSGFSWF